MLQDRRLAAQWKSNSCEQQQRTNAQAQPARGPYETPAQQPASQHGDAADEHAEVSQVLASMQHGQDIEAQLDDVMQDADDADVAVQFADADNPEQHAGMCQPICSEAFGQPPDMNISLVKMCPTPSSRQVEQAPQVTRMQPVCSHRCLACI